MLFSHTTSRVKKLDEAVLDPLYSHPHQKGDFFKAPAPMVSDKKSSKNTLFSDMHTLLEMLPWPLFQDWGTEIPSSYQHLTLLPHIQPFPSHLRECCLGGDEIEYILPNVSCLALRLKY